MVQSHHSWTPLCLLASACVTISHSETKPGRIVATRTIEERVHEIPGAIIEGETAFVRVLRSRCATLEQENERVEQQGIRRIHPRKVTASLIMMGVGTVALVGSSAADPSYKPALIGSGIGALVPATVVLLHAVTAGRRYETREVPASGTVTERREDCTNDVFTRTTRMPYNLAVGTGMSSGMTDEQGVLAFPSAVLETIANDVPAQEVPGVVRGDRLDVILQFGDLPPIEHALDIHALPDAWWNQLASALTPRFAPHERLWWDGCRAATDSTRAALRCMHDPRQAPRLARLEAPLERTDAGGHAAVHELRGREGERVTVRVLAPSANADWLAMIIDLERDAVVAEAFSSASDRLDVTAVLPRDGAYAIVIDAPRPGTFHAHVTLHASERR